MRTKVCESEGERDLSAWEISVGIDPRELGDNPQSTVRRDGNLPNVVSATETFPRTSTGGTGAILGGG